MLWFWFWFCLQWNIQPTPNGTCGVQQSLEGCLRQRIHHLNHTASPDVPFRQIHFLLCESFS